MTHQRENGASTDAARSSGTQRSKATSKLWVWCHPAIHDTVLEEIGRAARSFNSECTNVQAGKIDLTEAAISSTKTGAVSVKSLMLDLVRFRLIGPRSQALLIETLKPVLVFDEGNASSSSESATPSPSIPSPPVWWKGDLHQHMVAHSNILSQMLHSFKSAPGPAHVCKGAVIGMTVLDPRIFTPSKRTDKVSAYYPKKKNGYLLQRVINEKKIRKRHDSDLDSDSDSYMETEWDGSGVDGDTSETEEGGLVEDGDLIPAALEPVCDGQGSSLSTHQQAQVQEPQVSRLQSSSHDLPQDIAFSPVWDPNVRKIVSESKIPEHVLNLQRSKQLVRPSQQDLQRNASRIPILLIQQSFGSNQASGWDIILPSNWGMAFWVSRVDRGARACGLKELQKCSLEAQALHFPSDFPDTLAGQQYSDEQRQLLEAKYLRAPPDKRRNYGKLLIRQPFCCPWGEVVSAWSQDASIERVLPPEPQVVKNDRVTELCAPSKKRIKLSSGHESPELFESLEETETQVSLGEGSRPRKRNLDNSKEISSHAHVPLTFYVLRSHDPLNCIHHFVEYLFAKKTSEQVRRFPFSLESGLSMEASRFFSASMQQFQIDEHLCNHPSALLAIKFETTQRGTITDRATISLPSPQDLQLFTSSAGGEKRARSGPKEELNQRGLTVVDGETIFIGVSSLSRKEMKEVKRRRLDRIKRAIGKKKNGEFIMLICA